MERKLNTETNRQFDTKSNRSDTASCPAVREPRNEEALTQRSTLVEE